MDRVLLTIMDSADYAGVSRRTIYNWIKKRKVEYVRTAGGSVRIFKDTLMKDVQVASAGQPAVAAKSVAVD